MMGRDSYGKSWRALVDEEAAMLEVEWNLAMGVGFEHDGVGS